MPLGGSQCPNAGPLNVCTLLEWGERRTPLKKKKKPNKLKKNFKGRRLERRKEKKFSKSHGRDWSRKKRNSGASNFSCFATHTHTHTGYCQINFPYFSRHSESRAGARLPPAHPHPHPLTPKLIKGFAPGPPVLPSADTVGLGRMLLRLRKPNNRGEGRRRRETAHM